ncbi:hypothetical protein HDU87_002847 [Geranomyces variabilis]|uniref:Uncharacterized protein n=1 Tax=Geranomyces variabilis TaxID=109894 RepID=A0AAD5XRX9_9FUNG|nr:hypothetical protein HDU87_002847 [Geranomyces variabilis]
MLAASSPENEQQLEDSLQQLQAQTRTVAARIATVTIDVESRRAACTEAASEISRLRNFIQSDTRLATRSEPLTIESLNLEEEIVIREHMAATIHLTDHVARLGNIARALKNGQTPAILPPVAKLDLPPLLCAPTAKETAHMPEETSAADTAEDNAPEQSYDHQSRVLHELENTQRALQRELAKVTAYLGEVELMSMTAALDLHTAGTKT